MSHEILTVIFFSLVFIWICIRCVMLIKKHLLDNADSRTPHVLAAYGVTILLSYYTIKSILDGIIWSSYVFILAYFYVFVIEAINYGRLYGYQTAKLKRSTRDMISSIYYLLSSCLVIISIILYNKSFLAVVSSNSIFSVVAVSYTHLFGIYSNTILILLSSLGSAILIGFDIIEKRSKFRIRKDMLSIIPICVIIYFSNMQINNAYIRLLLVAISIFSTIFIIEYETQSILHKSNYIKSKLQSIRNAIVQLSKKNLLNAKDMYQCDIIVDMCKTDEELKKRLLVNKRFNKNYNIIIGYLRKRLAD